MPLNVCACPHHAPHRPLHVTVQAVVTRCCYSIQQYRRALYRLMSTVSDATRLTGDLGGLATVGTEFKRINNPAGDLSKHHSTAKVRN